MNYYSEAPAAPERRLSGVSMSLTQKQILEEIARCTPDDLKEKIAEIIKRKNHTIEQTNTIHETWGGLQFWRRTHVELMVKAYEDT